MRSRPRSFLEPLALKLFLCVSVLVFGALIPAAYFVAHQHFESSLDLKRKETYLQDKVIAMALQHQMLEGKRDLLGKLIEGFSSNPKLKRLSVLDHTGRVRLSNDPSFAERVFARDSPACRVCHARPPSERATSAVLEIEGGAVLRSVYPLRNQPACHRCHDPARTVNGVLITDTDVSDLRAQLRAQIVGTAVVVALVALVLLAGVTLTVRLLILRRLDRIEATTRAITAGDFDRRLRMPGTDAVSRLAGEFNAMADSVADLLSQLRRQRTQLENVMGSVDDGLLVVDRTFTVVAVNKSLAQRIGESREKLLYRRCSEIWTPPCGCDCAPEQCPAKACFETGRLHKSVLTRYTEDGTARDEEVFASPILGADGEVDQVVEVWRDITERKSQEARMAEFQRLVSLGMLASGFSHEMNTPLGTMLVHLDEVRRLATSNGASAGLGAGRSELEIIRSEILRCRDLTQQFLQLSRGHSVVRELMDVASVVRGTLPLIAHVATEAGVTVRIVGDATAPVALANVGAVRQVLLNILLNAVQASHRGGEVRVTCGAGASSSIRIEDDGVGMPPDVRENVFEPFFSRRPSGTGLGLFVSLNLARQWGGDIRVTSAPDHGSTFEITFPPVEGT